MKRNFVAAALAASLPMLAAAQTNHTFPCTRGSLERRVEIVYSGATDVPCEVHYFKEGAATPQVLWRAGTQAGYCESQAREFVAKLGGMGWTCADSGSPRAPVAGKSDDTEVLGAGKRN